MKYCCNRCTLIDKELHRDLKRLCIYYYGLGYLFATPKVRSLILDSMREFIVDLSNWFNEGKENKK